MRSVIVIVGLLSATAAFADQKQGAACAGGLPKDAKAIYDASLADAVKASDLRAVVEQKTKSLAMAGTISKMSARGSAEAAGKCLQLARQ